MKKNERVRVGEDIYLAVVEHEFGTDIGAHCTELQAGNALINLMISTIYDIEEDDEDTEEQLRKFNEACEQYNWQLACELYNKLFEHKQPSDQHRAFVRACKLRN